MEFRCKQFSLNHSKSTMKVGTDAVLLSALAPDCNAKRVLDCGCGCGIIALCMAQNYKDAFITAIDIDKNSVQEAQYNFSNSIFSKRMSAEEISFQSLAQRDICKYDLIISNPPFFINSLKSSNEKKNIARHTTNLSFSDLVFGVKKLLTDNGLFCVILPYEEFEKLESIAFNNGIFIKEKIFIYPRNDKPVERVVGVFSKIITDNPKHKTVILRDKDNTLSAQYKELTKEILL